MQESFPIVIFGAPRSGTTYLQRILNKHPDIGISDEARLFAWLHQSLNVLPLSDDFVFGYRDSFVKHLKDAYPNLIRAFYRAQFPGKRHWGDKNPHYADPKNRGCLNTIVNVFPGAKFIHIIRDGRDVVSSLIRKRHSDGTPWVSWKLAHSTWTDHVSIGCEFGKMVSDRQYFELKYEELVYDDVGYARKLLEFLEIPIHCAVLEFCENQQRERTPFSGPTRNFSHGATSSEWASLFSPSDQLRSLQMLMPGLLRQGYETESSLNRLTQRLRRLLASNPADNSDIARFLEIAQAVLPSTATVAVVTKGDDRLLDLRVGRAWHFPQDDNGNYTGYHPADSSEATSYLERVRVRGAEYLVFPMHSFWWLDHYSEFRNHLEREYRIIIEEDSCVVFALSKRSL